MTSVSEGFHWSTKPFIESNARCAAAPAPDPDPDVAGPDTYDGDNDGADDDIVVLCLYRKRLLINIAI